MRILKIYSILFLCGAFFACKKGGSSTTPSSAMSATVNGSTINFSANFSNNNGIITMTGSGSSYTIQLNMKLTGPGIYTLGDPSTNFYATVGSNFGNYGTSATSTGQVTVTSGASGGLYSGTFYFSAVETSPTPGGGTVSVANGSFSNM